MVTSRLELDERFTGGTLDTDVWFPYYLPHWSSRAGSAATFSLHGGELHLSVPVDQPLWCADLHEQPLRVSCIQSGSFAGPLGSTIGQQPFREGLEVREEQPTMWGYTPLYGHVEVQMRGVTTARSMFAFWMSGIEDRPERSGEICVAEVFGDAVRDGSADVSGELLHQGGVAVVLFRSIRGPASLVHLASDRPGVRHRTHVPELVGVLHRTDRLDPPV